MNLQVITIFIIATAILHVILQRMEELKKDNIKIKVENSRLKAQLKEYIDTFDAQKCGK